MASRGPKRKKRATKRTTKKTKDKPIMPDCLSLKARAEWRKVIRRANFGALQSEILAEYCEVLVDLRIAQEKARNQPVYEGPNGAMCSSPWVKQRDSLLMRFTQLAKTLKLDAKPEAKAKDFPSGSIKDFLKVEP